MISNDLFQAHFFSLRLRRLCTHKCGSLKKATLLTSQTWRVVAAVWACVGILAGRLFTLSRARRIRRAGMKNLVASALKMLWRPDFFSPQRSFSFRSCSFNVALPGRRNKNISCYQRGGYQGFSQQRRCLPQLTERGEGVAVGGRLVSQPALNLCDISSVCSFLERPSALRHAKVRNREMSGR